MTQQAFLFDAPLSPPRAEDVAPATHSAEPLDNRVWRAPTRGEEACEGCRAVAPFRDGLASWCRRCLPPGFMPGAGRACMTWLYVPSPSGASTSSRSAPEGEDWTAPSSWRSQVLAQSCAWRGKASPSLHWSRRLRTVSWLRRLSGAMCEPSRADASVAAWMASLAESPASRIAWPAGGAAATTSATCGLHAAPDGSSRRRGPGSSSSKTSAASSRRGLTKSLAPPGFCETYESLVTRARSSSSERTRWVSRTNAFASSSLVSPIGSWPTPTATDHKGANPLTRRPASDDDLATSVIRWPTATANDGVRTSPNKRGASNPSLPSAVTTWPTASARDWKGVDRKEIDRGNARPLNEVASTWATPNAHDGRRPGADLKSTQGRNLNKEAATWPTPPSLSFGDSHQPGNSRSYNKTIELAAGLNWSTPRATDGEKGGPNQAFGAGGVPLPAMAAGLNWSTPSVADGMGGRKARSGSRADEALMNGQALALSSDLLAPEMSTPGDMSPSSLLACYRRYRATTDFALRWERRALLLLAIRRRDPVTVTTKEGRKPARKPAKHGGAQVRAHRRGWTRERASAWVRPTFRRQLNARFVEWLMSWPPGLTSFECSETALRTHKALWRSELALMTSLPAAPPAQLSLFG